MHLTHLKPHSTYVLSVAAANGKLISDPASITIVSGVDAPSGPPTDIQVDMSTKGQIIFTWKPPLCGYRNGPIIGYKYQFVGKAIEYTDALTKFTSMTSVNLDAMNYTTNFKFRVAANTSKGFGPYSDEFIPTTNANSASAHIVVGVLLPLLLLVTLALLFFVIIRRKRREKRTSSTRPTTSQNVTNIGTNTEMSGSSSQNPANRVPEVFVRPTIELVLPEPSSDMSEGEPKPQERVDPTYAHIRKPSNSQVVDDTVNDFNIAKNTEYYRSNAKSSTECYRPNPKSSIYVKKLLEYVKQKKRNGPEHELNMEHETISDVGTELPAEVAAKEINEEKNRYKNIVTYDHSRVILLPVNDDPDTDYINASYIDGYRQPNAFIATQGPNKETLVDMWRMVWQENSRTIVMATNLKEGVKRKCQQYWPQRGKIIQYGDISVANKDEEKTKHFTVRTFLLEKASLNDLSTI
ncbi:uncharacterized protein [Amphiura filiformis]|uniref:uncharacterized protein n=1 Tax=Amphiura filiformis TaxID=82378 RepID=UPI003B22746B